MLAALSEPSGLRALDLSRKVFWLLRSRQITAIASQKAATVIKALKSYSRVDEGAEMVEIDLREDIESLLSLFFGKTYREVELRRDYSGEGLVRGRREQLDQVWINLINNALQAMEYSGALGISIFDAPGDLVGAAFSDNGVGIPLAQRDRIFKPFFSMKRKGEGSGLSLSICKTIVEEHGGSIGFESEPGRTVFTVLLPAVGASRIGDVPPTSRT